MASRWSRRLRAARSAAAQAGVEALERTPIQSLRERHPAVRDGSRKNWLFSDTVHGAKASANLYSLIETAKANGLEPYAYLRRVFTELPAATTVEDIEALLPWA